MSLSGVGRLKWKDMMAHGKAGVVWLVLWLFAFVLLEFFFWRLTYCNSNEGLSHMTYGWYVLILVVGRVFSTCVLLSS